MNILFRKNFQSDASKGGFGASRARGKRTGDYGYSAMDEHHSSYRTHIFLNPSNLPQEYEDEVKRPSVTLMKWSSNGTNNGTTRRKPSGGKSDFPFFGLTDTPTRQVSFSNNGSKPGTYAAEETPGPIALQSGPRAEPISLSTIDRDCFIIPVASIDRFLPAGVPLPLPTAKPSQLNVLEVNDPKLCVLIHLMTAMEPIEPILESPLVVPLLKQKSAACDLFTEVGSAKTAMEGMLLSNLESNAEFPFIAYYLINKNQIDPREFFYNCRAVSLKKFDPQYTRYTTGHTFDLYNEVATIARPPVETGTKRPSSAATGYIISVFKVFEGDDGEKFEKNWLYWTGARMIYRYLPKSVGLRRITLHKSQSTGDKYYLLMVECSNFLQDLTAAAALIPALRARLCGYTGLYRSTAVF